MNRKNGIKNIVYIFIAIIAFSISVFKTDNQVWIGAWIAPVFLMRFIRTNKWLLSILIGFVSILVASFIGMLPVIKLYSTAATTSQDVDFQFIFNWQVKSGSLFIVPSFLLPFLLDKVLYTRLPKWATTLVYPSCVILMELIYNLTVELFSSFGGSQYSFQPFVMVSTLIGVIGLSFLITWFAPVINLLWENKWRIKNLKRFGLVYFLFTSSFLLYGSILIGFPKKTQTSVPVAGITTYVDLEAKVVDSGLSVIEVSQLGPDDYADIMRSSQWDIDDMRRKTLEAIDAGAKIIIWQETALMLESNEADRLLEEMRSTADERNVYLLITYERLLNASEKNKRPMRNTSTLFTPEGAVAWNYDKAFPIPGFEDYLVSAGPRDIPFIDTPYGRIGQVICADLGFPFYILQAAKNKIDILIGPSWDQEAFTPASTFKYGLRAVENGLTLIRITGEGYSIAIDPYFRQWGGLNSFIQGTSNFYCNIPVLSRNTFYSVIGHIFPFVISIFLLFLIFLVISKECKMNKKRKR